MTPDELKVEMEKLVNGTPVHDPWKDDPDTAHKNADLLLIAVLWELGYGEAMDIYEAQTRWFA